MIIHRLRLEEASSERRLCLCAWWILMQSWWWFAFNFTIVSEFSFSRLCTTLISRHFTIWSFMYICSKEYSFDIFYTTTLLIFNPNSFWQFHFRHTFNVLPHLSAWNDARWDWSRWRQCLLTLKWEAEEKRILESLQFWWMTSEKREFLVNAKNSDDDDAGAS